MNNNPINHQDWEPVVFNKKKKCRKKRVCSKTCRK